MLLNHVAFRAFRSNGGRGRHALGLAAMLAPLLGYFFCMIAVLTVVVGVMIGLSNTSTSERVRHYPRAVVERNVTATPTEPRLFMVVPERDRSSVKDVEANSAAVPTEKPNKPYKPKVLARQHQNYEGRGYAMTLGHSQGYSPGLDGQR
jgi:uncharacterized membrane protein